jgi:hypothetical protein
VNAGTYGSSFTINQSVTIDCAGAVGFTAGNITIDGAGIVVRLRNMSINSEGYRNTGINALKMAALYIENCVISNFNDAQGGGIGIGIAFSPLTGPSQLFVTNSIIANDGGPGGTLGDGIYIEPETNVTATVSIDRSEINGNLFGIVADGTSGGTIRGTIKNSVVSGNIQNGITANNPLSGSVVLMVDGIAVASNGNHGLVAGGNAGMLVRNTDVFNNGGGLYTVNGGTLYSYGNNKVNGNNGNDGTFTGTVGQQ